MVARFKCLVVPERLYDHGEPFIEFGTVAAREIRL